MLKKELFKVKIFNDNNTQHWYDSIELYNMSKKFGMDNSFLLLESFDN